MDDYGKIAVFAGGPSSEREISLESGRAVYGALKKRAENAEFFDVNEDFPRGLDRFRDSIVFLALHGSFGEDGTIQAILEELGIPYTGSGVRASRLAMNKVASREVFSANGLRVPRYEVVNRPFPTPAWKWAISKPGLEMGFEAPFVVKPRSGGSSIGLSIVRDKVDLAPALEKAFQYEDTVIVEEYVQGRELTVGILEEGPLPVIEITTKHNVYDFDAKYLDGETEYILPAALEKDVYRRVQEYALKAHRILGCRDFSRVDMRMDGSGNVYVLEVNTIPGMTERSLLPKAAGAAGVNFEDLCVKLVELAHRRKEQKHAEKEQTRKKSY